jgi:hypothetical protein
MGNSEVEVHFVPWPYDAVARGVALLDERVPGWREKINVETLDMGDYCFCVLGQQFGDFGEGLINLDFDLGDGDLAREYGFQRLAGHSDDEYQALTDAWREVIAEGSK